MPALRLDILICGLLAAMLATAVSAGSPPHRNRPPRLALRPEVSEGEWAAFEPHERLSPRDLASAATTVAPARHAAAVAVGEAAVAPLRERILPDPAPLAASSLDQPLSDAGALPIEVPSGLDLIRGGFRIDQVQSN